MITLPQQIAEQCAHYLLEEPRQDYRAHILDLMNSPSLTDQAELFDRMHRMLSFGTAGIRGAMEAGYNRMNTLLVYRLSHALAFDLMRNGQKTVVIGFDARHNSRDFAAEASLTFTAMGHVVHIFNEAIPTPLCAYATKNLSADLGVMVTASHNPKRDNGIKLYQKNSAQLGGDILFRLEQLMIKAPMRHEFLKTHHRNDLKESIKNISDDVFENYLADIKTTRFFHDSVHKNLDIAYTPLHGVGKKFFLKAMHQEGLDTICVVAPQGEPDGQFPTVTFPNPEEDNTLDVAHSWAQEKNIDVVFAHDPDADRLQVSLRKDGHYVKLSGNEMGIILAYFTIVKAQENNIKPLLATSIVSSRMLKAMCQHMGAHYAEALTGFSNIVDKALSYEAQGFGEFLFGYEEALGFLVGRVVLDKDGINAGARFAEVIEHVQKNHKTIWHLLDELYINFGLYQSCQWSERFTEINRKTLDQVMEIAKNISSQDIAKNLACESCQKYDLNERQDDNQYTGLKANVIIFESATRRLIVRPSGTEPKIKFYLEIADRATSHVDCAMKRLELERKLLTYQENIRKLLGGLT